MSLPGASARQERVRRTARREAQVRTAHPIIGNFLLKVTNDPLSTRVWDRGAVGEEFVARALEPLAQLGAYVLHDRRRPGTTANIDHLVIATSGVWIIDTKKYKGRVELRRRGRRHRVDVRLFVNDRDRTRLIDGMHKQVEAVKRIIGDPTVPIRPVLCFQGAEWSMFAKPFAIDGVIVTWPKALVQRITKATAADIDPARIHIMLAEALPPAAK